MSLSSESKPRLRDKDLALAQDVQQFFSPDQGDFFILTGSYAIQAVTKNPSIVHNDVDANVFTTNTSRSIATASQELMQLNMDLIKRTDSRLEYVRNGSLIELQFVRYDRVNPHQSRIDFMIDGKDDSEVVVPTIDEVLFNSSMEPYQFRVKTLPFMIGTWALRISGFAEAQKRDVRQSDIDHFRFLVQAAYDQAEVSEAIAHHPQLPTNFIGHEQYVLEAALRIMDQNEDQSE